MTINLTDPANHPANSPLTGERIERVIEALQRSIQYQNGGDMAYVIADAVKGLRELLVSKEAAREPVTGEELDQMIWKLERDGMTPKMLSLMRELRELRKSSKTPAAIVHHDEKGFHALLCRELPEGTPLYVAPAAPVTPDGWREEAERLAELHGCSFVVFRHGEEPQCADPTKVIISFTDKGLGYPDARNAPATRDCQCHTCRPVTMNDMRFVVCPECGNKRCPHANDHNNACTGSNEPGQAGSAYPAAPQEVKL